MVDFHVYLKQDNVGADQVLDAVETVAFEEATQLNVDKKAFYKTNIGNLSAVQNSIQFNIT